LFGTVPASGIVSTSDSLIVVVSPAGGTLGPVAISVVTPNGAVDWEGGFDYEISVNSIYPESGSLAGGLSVAITGAGLLQVYGINFNDTPVVNFVTKSDGLITLTTPAGTTAGSVDISLLGLNGNAIYIEFGGFTYLAAKTPVDPGTKTPADPGAKTPADPGAKTPADPGAKTPADPGTKTPADPGAKTPTDPGAKTPADPGAKTPTDPSTKTPADPGTKAPTDPGTKTPADPPAGNFIPGGAMIVPDGKTGLGGTAGTGAGFGVGTLLPGGGGSAPPSNLPYYTDPGLTAQLVQSLISLVQNAASPDALEAQNLILRRIALEGDVIGSRIPPPRNISEIGGYLNLLDTLKEKAMREQTLAGILGVAGPTQPLGWISNTLPLAMVAVTNDRPAVAAQPSFPLTILVRSDFVAGVQAAFKQLHGYGATLPLTSPSVITLPAGGTGTTAPPNILLYLGRTLTIAPNAALINPAADPIAIIQSSSGPAAFQLVARALNPGTFVVPPVDANAVQCTPTSQTLTQINQAPLVPLAPILAAAGYYSPSPLPVPANSTIKTWAQFTNITGLVPGVTRLGDELSLLYRQDQIVNSVFAAMLTWTWNGSTFAA
jgi:hypothetical protein